MKNLKLGLLSLLAVLAVSVFFTACEQEDITTQPLDGLYDSKLNMESKEMVAPSLKKDIILVDDAAKSKSGIATKASISIESNYQELLDLLNENTLKLVSSYELEEAEDKRAEETGNEQSTLPEVDDFDSNEFEKTVVITLNSFLGSGKETSYTIEFDESLRNKFKEENILTEIVFTDTSLATRKKGKGEEEYPDALNKDWTGQGPFGPGNFYWFNPPSNSWVKAAIYRSNGTSTKVWTYHVHCKNCNEHLLSTKYFSWCHHTWNCNSNHYITRGRIAYGLVTSFTLSSNCYRRC